MTASASPDSGGNDASSCGTITVKRTPRRTFIFFSSITIPAANGLGVSVPARTSNSLGLPPSTITHRSFSSDYVTCLQIISDDLHRQTDSMALVATSGLPSSSSSPSRRCPQVGQLARQTCPVAAAHLGQFIKSESEPILHAETQSTIASATTTAVPRRLRRSVVRCSTSRTPSKAIWETRRNSQKRI